MKKMLVLVILIVLFSCACTIKEEVKADLPEGFEIVEEQEFDHEEIYVIKHKKTGCYYTYIVGIQAIAIEQMYNRTGKPYCE